VSLQVLHEPVAVQLLAAQETQQQQFLDHGPCP
jgi:hypothetical protein